MLVCVLNNNNNNKISSFYCLVAARHSCHCMVNSVRSLDGVESKIETAVSGKTAVLGKVYTLIKILVGQKRGGKRLLCLTVVTLLGLVLFLDALALETLVTSNT